MFQAEEAGQKVDHHICVSHLPRLASPGTDSQLQEHQDSIKVSRENIGTVPAPVPYTRFQKISLKNCNFFNWSFKQ